MCKQTDISRMVEDRGSSRKSYMPRSLAQQWMTLSDLEWPFHGSLVPSVWGRGVHCDHTVHFGTDLALWLDSPTIPTCTKINIIRIARYLCATV